MKTRLEKSSMKPLKLVPFLLTRIQPSGFMKFHFEIRSPLVLKALVGFQLGNQTSPQVTFDFLTDWDVSCLN